MQKVTVYLPKTNVPQRIPGLEMEEQVVQKGSLKFFVPSIVKEDPFKN